MNEQQIESLLRKSPEIRAPRELREQLKSEIELTPGFVKRSEHTPLGARSFRRWIPALGFALWFLTCVVVLGVQAGRIAELKERNRALEVANHSAAAVAPADPIPVQEAAAVASAKEQEEIKRLRAEVAELRAILAELPALNEQNAKLRAEIATRRAANSAPAVPQQDFFVVQQERAAVTRCVNNVKQLGLAARIASNQSRSDRLPLDFEGLKPHVNEKILVCGNTPYTMLSPGASESIPQTVYVRCSIHNVVGLVDGSAHILGTDRRVVQRDGVWVIER